MSAAYLIIFSFVIAIFVIALLLSKSKKRAAIEEAINSATETLKIYTVAYSAKEILPPTFFSDPYVTGFLYAIGHGITSEKLGENSEQSDRANCSALERISGLNSFDINQRINNLVQLKDPDFSLGAERGTMIFLISRGNSFSKNPDYINAESKAKSDFLAVMGKSEKSKILEIMVQKYWADELGKRLNKI